MVHNIQWWEALQTKQALCEKLFFLFQLACTFQLLPCSSSRRRNGEQIFSGVFFSPFYLYHFLINNFFCRDKKTLSLKLFLIQTLFYTLLVAGSNTYKPPGF